MKKIYKYTLNYYKEPEELLLPKGAQIVDFQIQNKSFQLWALIDPEAKEEKRIFLLAFTGADIPWKVIASHGTRIVEESGIVVHLLELDPATTASSAKEDSRLQPN